MAKLEDFTISTIKKLISEEKDVIEYYKKAIRECADEEAVEVFENILEEKEEHIKELNKLLPKNMRDYKVKDSILQEYAVIRKRNEAKYGKYFYNYVDKYLNLNSDLYLSDLYYKESEWNKFINWYNKQKKITDSAIKKVVYTKPIKYNRIYFSIEGSEEGEIFDDVPTLTEARSKLRELKKSDKEYDIEQQYSIYKHYETDDSDYIEEV